MNHRKEDDKMNEIKEYTEKVFEDIKKKKYSKPKFRIFYSIRII